MKALLVDDERKNRVLLRSLIEQYVPQITSIQEAEGVVSGLHQLRNFDPDIIFLDVQLRDGNGFDFLLQSQHRRENVVFVTAYREHAVKAFRFNAIDYLLKPIDRHELINSVKRVASRNQSQGLQKKLFSLLEERLPEVDNNQRRLKVKTINTVHFIQIDQLVRCEADVNYTRLYMQDGSSILTSKTLKEFENELSTYQFLRCHKTHLINSRFIKSYARSSQPRLILSNGESIPVSLRKKDLILQWLD